MSTSSDPRDWYRQEELALEQVRRRLKKRSRRVGLVYAMAVVIATLVALLLAMAYGVVGRW